jgi:hypothetical protein
MDVRSQSPASGADQIAALRAELDQRDATIELLAQQLEDAANRLDWLNRCGNDREAPAGSGRQQEGHAGADSLKGETADRLNQFLQQWEQVELGESLERIDRRLSHVFEVLKSFEPGGESPSRSASSPASRHQEPAEPAVGSLLSAFLISQSSDNRGSTSSPASEAAKSAPPGSDVPKPAESDAGQHEVCLLPLPDFCIPSAIDLASAPVEALRAAIVEREECIQQLIARSRIAEANRTNSTDWKSLEGIPEKLLERLNQLELDLRQTIKQEELSGSIERAKISRDRAHLDQVRKELEAQIRKLGEGKKPEAAAPPAGGDPKASGKRWGKVFKR